MKSNPILIRLAFISFLFLGLLGLRLPQRTLAAQPATTKTDARPLAELLNSNGRLNLTTGISGTLDPSGWRMGYVPDGKPIFKQAELGAPADTWNALGGGLNNMVKAIAVAGPNVYVGGAFTDAGGFLNADNIPAGMGQTGTRWGVG